MRWSMLWSSLQGLVTLHPCMTLHLPLERVDDVQPNFETVSLFQTLVYHGALQLSIFVRGWKLW